eukprot:scaffold14328_cov143-Isochrysis_galbana.AAC.2
MRTAPARSAGRGGWPCHAQSTSEARGIVRVQPSAAVRGDRQATVSSRHTLKTSARPAFSASKPSSAPPAGS